MSNQTRQLYNGTDTFTEFSKWLRKLDNPLDSSSIDCNNLDFMWFNYREGWFITIEEKRYGKQQSKNQRESQSILYLMLKKGSGETGLIVPTMRGKRRIQYRGHYVIIFEQTDPENSQWCKVNNVKHNNVRDVIIDLLTNGKISN